MTAADGSNSGSTTFSWSVTNQKVTVSNPGTQSSTGGNNVSLQILASDPAQLPLTYSAVGLPEGLSINATSGLISGTIASSAGGAYAVTVMASDSQGNSGSAAFTWNVNLPANSLTLTNPGNQSNAEGDNVSLQVQANDPDGDILEYAASGLPIGLWIDPTTGLIQGTVDYSAAEISGGQYNVTVTVNDGNGNSASQSLVWSIADTDQGPWLSQPEMQGNNIGDQVSLQLYGFSPDGKTLTYTASNLPPGLSINSSSGLISGTIASTASTTTPYNVSVTASDGIKSASQSFSWEINQPLVVLAINGSTSDEDHVLLMNPVQAVPMQVTLENVGPGVYQVQLSVPDGMSSLSASTVQLSNGGSTTVMVTPKQPSTQADDVMVVAMLNNKEVGKEPETNETVTFPAKIQNADTPTGMKPRIPPGVATPVSIKLSADPPPSSVVVTVNGNNANTGVALFLFPVGALLFPYNVTFLDAESNDVNLYGITQTAPTADGKGGNAGNLKLQVESADPKTVKVLEKGATSAGFSVAAIPIKIIMSDPTPNKGKVVASQDGKLWNPSWGALYKVTVVSDSGEQNDLNQILISEKVGAVGEEAPNPQVSGFIKLSQLRPDRNTIGFPEPKNLTKEEAKQAAVKDLRKFIDGKEGKKLTYDDWQDYVFIENRTGSVDKDGKAIIYVVVSSGFNIVKVAEKKGDQYLVTVTKTAKEVAAAKPGVISKANSAPVTDEIK